MDLTTLTWPAVEEYLDRRRDVLVPVGSTEQHGRFGLLGTDVICPVAIAAAVSERDGILVAPPIAFGNAQHHLAFPGTISLRPQTFVSLVVDVVESLRHHGFEHVVFLNGHGGNTAPLRTAFAEVHASTSIDGAAPVALTAIDWWEGGRVQALERELFGDRSGQHATCGEISVTWHVHPDSVRPPEQRQDEPPFSTIHDAADFRRRYPNGAIGADASLCDRDGGGRLIEAAVDDVIDTLGQVRETL